MEILIDFFILALVYVGVYQKKLKKRETLTICKFTVFYIYIAMVFYVTIIPFEISIISHTDSLMEHIHTIPFADLRANRTGAMRECLLNVVMMMPFGFLLGWMKRNSNVISIALSTLLFSACIEIIQLYYCLQGALHSRSCDVTDLVTNTLGGIFGYLIYRLIKSLVKSLFKVKSRKGPNS